MRSKIVANPWFWPVVAVVTLAVVGLSVGLGVFLTMKNKKSSSGGNSTGGNSTGGNSTGGNSTGGNSTGGNSTGGNSTGGNSTDGSALSIPPTFVKSGDFYIPTDDGPKINEELKFQLTNSNLNTTITLGDGRIVTIVNGQEYLCTCSEEYVRIYYYPAIMRFYELQDNEYIEFAYANETVPYVLGTRLHKYINTSDGSYYVLSSVGFIPYVPEINAPPLRKMPDGTYVPTDNRTRWLYLMDGLTFINMDTGSVIIYETSEGWFADEQLNIVTYALDTISNGRFYNIYTDDFDYYTLESTGFVVQ
jgi:hypothetical protein